MENCKKNEFVPEYRTPKIKVAAFNAQGVLCSSFDNNSLDDWERGEDI